MRNYVSEFGSKILSTDGFVLFCKVCELKINFEKKFNVSQHIRTEKHVKSAKHQKDQVQRKSQQLLTNQPTKSEFNKDLCEAMLAANTPFKKLSNATFRSFLEKYTGKSIPFKATLRKGYIDDIYNQLMYIMRIEIGKNQN